jgi:hypothetical protein
MGDARLTAEPPATAAWGVNGYTEITDQRRRQAYEETQRQGL